MSEPTRGSSSGGTEPTRTRSRARLRSAARVRDGRDTAGTLRSPPERSSRHAGHGADTPSELHLTREWEGQCEVTAAGTGASLQNHLETQHRWTGHNRAQSPEEKDRRSSQLHRPPHGNSRPRHPVSRPPTPRQPVGLQPTIPAGPAGGENHSGSSRAPACPGSGARRQRERLPLQTPSPAGEQSAIRLPGHPPGRRAGAAQSGADGLPGTPRPPPHAGPAVAERTGQGR